MTWLKQRSYNLYGSEPSDNDSDLVIGPRDRHAIRWLIDWAPLQDWIEQLWLGWHQEVWSQAKSSCWRGWADRFVFKIDKPYTRWRVLIDSVRGDSMSKMDPISGWSAGELGAWLQRMGKSDIERFEVLKGLISNRVGDQMSQDDYYLCVQARNYLAAKIEQDQIAAEVDRRIEAEGKFHLEAIDHATSDMASEGGSLYD